MLDAQKELKQKQHDQQMEQHVRYLEQALKTAKESEDRIKADQANFDRKLKELQKAVGGGR